MTTAVVLIEAERDAMATLGGALADLEGVAEAYSVTGEWDFVLILVVQSMDQYTALTRGLFFASKNVKRFKTLVVMDRVKATLDVPVGTPST